MAQRFREMSSTPHVLAAQKQYFGRAQAPAPAGRDDFLTLDEAGFISGRDSLYMATISETGWPYLQHRGGPAGFVKVLSPSELAFADYRGNRQLLSTGNAATNDRVSLFFMDYPNRERLKIMGHLKVLDAREHPELVKELASPGMAALTERIFQVKVIAYDWNCPQYITPRYTEDEVRGLISPLHDRIAHLESLLPPNS